MVIGRICWDKEGRYPTPWVSFKNVTEYRKWTRDMRKAIGFPAKSEYALVDSVWTAAGLLNEANRKRNKTA